MKSPDEDAPQCVTELATLQIKSPLTLSSPHVQNFLRNVSRAQAAWSSYPVLFFQDVKSTNVIYLISGWESTSAHDVWIASEENQSLLKEASQLVEVKGIMHLSINFKTFPTNAEKLVGFHIPNACDTREILSEDTTNCRAGSWKAMGDVIDGEGRYLLMECMGRNQGCGGECEVTGGIEMVPLML